MSANSSNTIERLKLHDAYKHLSIDLLIKTSIGATVGWMVMMKCPMYRRNLSFLGAGIGIGNSIQEINYYLKDPIRERLPNTLNQIQGYKDKMMIQINSAKNKIFPTPSE